ncbi:MAG: hypothetical protein ACK41V_21325 [Acidovorax sp.]|uniref:hypothetical protein n=1 Tax=Acidovorax sp. TaxID=1872122 RepID=UPI00391D1E9E
MSVSFTFYPRQGDDAKHQLNWLLIAILRGVLNIKRRINHCHCGKYIEGETTALSAIDLAPFRFSFGFRDQCCEGWVAGVGAGTAGGTRFEARTTGPNHQSSSPAATCAGP